MAITEAFTGTATIGTAENSCTTNTAGPDVETSDGVFQCFLELNALADGDIFEFRVYEKVLTGSTQRQALLVTITNAQVDAVMVIPSLILINGWDMTLKKVVGTDRSISWSIRKLA